MPRKSPFEIELTEDERAELESLSSRYTAPYIQVVRAKLVLLAAEGLENRQIAQKLDLPRQVVSKWRQRFFYERLEGLKDRPRPGRPVDFSPSGSPSGQGGSL